jgi:hypothetical protein
MHEDASNLQCCKLGCPDCQHVGRCVRSNQQSGTDSKPSPNQQTGASAQHGGRNSKQSSSVQYTEGWNEFAGACKTCGSASDCEFNQRSGRCRHGRTSGMDASGTTASSSGYSAEDSGDGGEEDLFGCKQAGTKAEGEDRNRRLSLALKTSSPDVYDSTR